MNAIAIGSVVMRTGEKSLAANHDIGDVVEINGDRCRVAWRDREYPNFYRPEEMSVRKGKKTWVKRTSLMVAA